MENNTDIVKLLYEVNQVMKTYDTYHYDRESNIFFTRHEGRFVQMACNPLEEVSEKFSSNITINGKEFFDVFKTCKKPNICLETMRLLDEENNVIENSGVNILENFRLKQFLNSEVIEFGDKEKTTEIQFNTVDGIDPCELGITFPELIIQRVSEITNDTGSPIIYMEFNLKNNDILLKRSKVDIDFNNVFLIAPKSTFKKYKSLKKDIQDNFFSMEFNPKLNNTLNISYGNTNYIVSITMNGVFKLSNK